MKSIVWAAAVVLSIMAVSAAHAQSKVYTWTDAKGRLNITDTPPPADAKIKDVVEETGPTPADARQLQDQQQQRIETRQDEQRRIEVEEALRRAREADDQARAAVQRAEEQTREALDYRKRFGNTPSRRQDFKYKIRAEEEKAIQAQAEAQRAVERAKVLSEEARTAVGPDKPPKP
jgi:membrane protein involved in colicin uptake